MMLPILMVVSVAPVSYFFCASAGTVAAAMINPDSPTALTTALTKFVVKKSLAKRFMIFLLGCGPALMACCRTVSCWNFFGNDWERISAGTEYRKRRQVGECRSSEANCRAKRRVQRSRIG